MNGSSEMIEMQMFVGAKALIRRPDGKVLIVRESLVYEEGTNAGKFDVVGGRIASGESLLDGLQREVKEESGLTVKVVRVLHAADNFPVLGGEQVHIVRVYFLCTTEDAEVKLSADHDEYEWIDPAKYQTRELVDDLEQAFKNLVETT